MKKSFKTKRKNSFDTLLRTYLKSFGQSTINQLAINSTQKRKKPQSQSRHQTVKRGLKHKAKKFNPIKRLVFEKDIFNEK